MTRLSNVLAAVLAVALVAVALESELPQRIAGRLNFWPEVMRPGRDVDTVAADLQRIYPTRHADIVMLGDSLTAEADWRELLPGRDVVNRGVAGRRRTMSPPGLTRFCASARAPCSSWRAPTI